VYKFKLDKDYKARFPYRITFKNDWVNIEKHSITVKKGYSWDGCTPYLFNLLGLWAIKTPDGVCKEGKQMLYYPSLIHDVLYQFKGEMPLLRIEVDKIFFYDMVKKGFIFANVYYLMVRLFGGFFGKWTYYS
jgi:hypothetical protein